MTFDVGILVAMVSVHLTLGLRRQAHGQEAAAQS